MKGYHRHLKKSNGASKRKEYVYKTTHKILNST